jgi:hypothetical protein
VFPNVDVVVLHDETRGRMNRKIQIQAQQDMTRVLRAIAPSSPVKIACVDLPIQVRINKNKKHKEQKKEKKEEKKEGRMNRKIQIQAQQDMTRAIKPSSPVKIACVDLLSRYKKKEKRGGGERGGNQSNVLEREHILLF